MKYSDIRTPKYLDHHWSWQNAFRKAVMLLLIVKDKEKHAPDIGCSTDTYYNLGFIAGGVNAMYFRTFRKSLDSRFIADAIDETLRIHKFLIDNPDSTIYRDN